MPSMDDQVSSGISAARVSVGAAVVLGALLAVVSCSSDSGSPATPDGNGDAAADGSSIDPDGSSPDPDGGTPSEAGVEGPWSFVTLKTQTFTVNNTALTVEFVRADRPDGGKSYLLYQHALAPAAPLVIVNEPYARIDWTGEEIDTRWYALADGAQPDVDAPNYNGTDKIAVPKQSPEEAVNGNNLWAINGFASIHAYGRFYVGGSLADDALDAAAPYYFARTRPTEIDASRIGSYGGSWGGMMALFGARRAPSDAKALAVAAMSPPSDFVDLWTWSHTDLPAVYPNQGAVTAFYSPYWRRSVPVLGDPPSPSDASKPFTHAGLCPGLPGKVLVPHDGWDVIIPVRQTEDLAAACPNVEPLYWRRPPIDYGKAAIDHGPATSEGKLPSVFTFSVTFLVEALAPPSATVLASAASQPSLEIHLQLVLAEQKAGHDVSYVLPRLRELADPRLKLLEAETNQVVDGADLLARAINGVWKTSFDGPGVRTQLVTGLPTPP